MLPKAGKGIETGVGTGRFAEPLGISLGVEPAEAMRNIALKRGVNVVAGVAESLPVEDGFYDYALLVTTACLLYSPEIAFREVRRILKPAGSIIVGLIDRDSKRGKEYEEKKSESKFYRDANFHSVKEIQTDLTKTGFGNYKYVRAILPGDIDEGLEPGVRQGFGEGSFVVLRAQK